MSVAIIDLSLKTFGQTTDRREHMHRTIYVCLMIKYMYPLPNNTLVLLD